MDMSCLNGATRMAYLSGMQALQDRGSANDRMLLSARQGGVNYSSFAQVLMQQEKSTSGKSKDYSHADPNIAAARKELAGISWNNSDEYMDHLKDKYGVIRVESVAKDQASLDKVRGTMCSGQDVVISPVALEKMANDPEKAARIEGTIDYFFSNIPQYEAEAAAMGLTFESCGCVVHDDGTVTYICGASDPPERVAEVERIHREKLEKEAETRRHYFEKAQMRAQEMREMEEASREHREIIRRMVQSVNGGDVSADATVFTMTQISHNSIMVSSMTMI